MSSPISFFTTSDDLIDLDQTSIDHCVAVGGTILVVINKSGYDDVYDVCDAQSLSDTINATIGYKPNPYQHLYEQYNVDNEHDLIVAMEGHIATMSGNIDKIQQFVDDTYGRVGYI